MCILIHSIRFGLFTFLLTAGLPMLLAQDGDSDATEMELTGELVSLPKWKKSAPESVQNLTSAVRKFQAGVFLVGNARGTGTAFVISREHRLLATNAHVADILHETGSMLAIQNDSTQVFEVDQIWYHPGVCRRLRGSLPVRSPKPEDGSVDVNSPDVAVLQLAEGAALPMEFEMATADELNNLFAETVGMLGYPSHDTNWPSVGERPAGTFRDGVISRVSNFFNRGDAPQEELQQLQHSMMSYGGFSGSPIFLPNGHVVALHNAGAEIDTGARIQFGVRIDCLWELLAYHKLDSLIPIGTERENLLLERYIKSSPEEENFRKAVALEVEAKRLIANRKFDEAVEKCEEAIKLAPGFADAYYTRGNAFNNYVQEEDRLSDEQKLHFMTLALADSKKYCQLNPSDREGRIEFCVTACNWTNEKTGSQRNANVSEIITDLLQRGGLNDDLRSRAHRTRAQANGWDETTLPDLTEAIRLQPFEENNYLARSYYWRYQGDTAQEQDDLNTYERLNEAYRLRRESASEPDRQTKVNLARQTCELTKWSYWLDIQRLAIYLWAAGDVEEAVTQQTRAVEMAPEEEKSKSRRYLKQMVQDLENQRQGQR